jgi:hypothetical protein
MQKQFQQDLKNNWKMAKKVYLILLVTAAISILLGFLLAGGGHGWVTAFKFSFLPLIVTPICGYGFIKNKKLVLLLVIVLYIFVSYVFYFMTLEEGEGYFERVFEGITGLAVLFVCTWVIPLLISIYGLAKKAA